MAPGDLEAVAALARRADPFGWTLRNFQDALASGYPMTVLEGDGAIAGYSGIMVVGDEAELLEIAVDPARQGRGLGRRLLAEAMRRARAEAARVMHLEVRVSNARARKMYHSAGFEEVGRRRNYYPADPSTSGGTGREDAILMRRDFPGV